MTPALFDLPVRPNEASALAGLILEHAASKAITDDLRTRLAGRTAALKLESIQPCLGSLERDPVHPAAILLAVDGLDRTPLLLRIAPASTPSSGLFPKSILIGRMRSGRQEIVVNASPFGPGDHNHLQTFASDVNKAFLPKPQASRPALTVGGEFPSAFDAFRAVLKSRSLNLACVGSFEDSPSPAAYYAGLWSAIRAGWREGYSVEAGGLGSESRGSLQQLSNFTKYSFACERENAVASFRAITASKSGGAQSRSFDLEVLTESSDPAGIAADLTWYRERGVPVQLIAPALRPDNLGALAAITDAVRPFQTTVSVHHDPNFTPEQLDGIGRATGGRWNYKIPAATLPSGTRAEVSAFLVDLADRLIG